MTPMLISRFLFLLLALTHVSLISKAQGTQREPLNLQHTVSLHELSDVSVKNTQGRFLRSNGYNEEFSQGGQDWSQFDISKQFSPGGVGNGCLKVGASGEFPECDPKNDRCCTGMECIKAESKGGQGGKEEIKEVYKCGNQIEQMFSPAYQSLETPGVVKAETAPQATEETNADSDPTTKEDRSGAEATKVILPPQVRPTKVQSSHYMRWYYALGALVLLCLGINLYTCIRRSEYTRID